MIPDKKIKVVKRKDVVKTKAPRAKRIKATSSARSIVSNVSDWVADLRQRKSSETRAAIESLFITTVTPSES